MSAYWISPKGNIMEVDSRHIHSIIAHPELFGMTRAQIMAAYRKRGEHLGQEGNAREDIMVRLIRKGWIRVRYVPQQYLVTAQLSRAYHKSGSHVPVLTSWAREMMKRRDMPESVSVNILDLQGEYVMPSGHQLYEIAAGALYEKRKVGTFAEYLNPRKRKRK